MALGKNPIQRGMGMRSLTASLYQEAQFPSDDENRFAIQRDFTRFEESRPPPSCGSQLQATDGFAESCNLIQEAALRTFPCATFHGFTWLIEAHEPILGCSLAQAGHLPQQETQIEKPLLDPAKPPTPSGEWPRDPRS